LTPPLAPPAVAPGTLPRLACQSPPEATATGSSSSSRRGPRLGGLGGASEGVDQLSPPPANAESLLAEFGAVDRLLREAKKGSRLERQQQRAEERKQEREEEERWLRQELAARERVDPRLKIAERLQQSRQGDGPVAEGHRPSLAGPSPGVPMKAMKVNGGRGHETVMMVDVEALRKRCSQLGQAPSVQSLLEERRQKERQRQFTAAARVRLQASLSAPQLQSDIDSCSESMLFPSQMTLLPGSWEERRHRALVRKKQGEYENWRNRVSAMRGGRVAGAVAAAPERWQAEAVAAEAAEAENSLALGRWRPDAALAATPEQLTLPDP